MVIFAKLRELRRSPKKYIITIVLAVVVIVLGFYSYNVGGTRSKLDYNESLSEIAVTVNGVDITLRDMAFYVVYEEQEVERQALVYNPEKTLKYWNLHIDGEFVRIAARNAAIQMAIHDELFCQMAQKEGVELSEEELMYADNTLTDFWSDMQDFDQQNKIKLDKEVYGDIIKKAALAQKYQEIYAALQGERMDEYNFDGDLYKKLLEENTYSINKKVWNRIDVGNVSLRH